MIEPLNDLLDAELNSVFAFFGEGMPYVDRSHAALNRPLVEMVKNSRRRAERLVELIQSVGGSPIPRGLQPREQQIAYLSISFLLPKLVEAKERDITRYRKVRSVMKGEAVAALDEMIAEQVGELAALRK